MAEHPSPHTPDPSSDDSFQPSDDDQVEPDEPAEANEPALSRTAQKADFYFRTTRRGDQRPNSGANIPVETSTSMFRSTRRSRHLSWKAPGVTFTTRHAFSGRQYMIWIECANELLPAICNNLSQMGLSMNIVHAVFDGQFVKGHSNRAMGYILYQH